MEEERWIYLLRHGEPDRAALGNGDYMIGQYDLGLTKEGQAAAAAMAEHLANIPFAAVFASDLIRARETAVPIASRQGIQATLCPALREIALGEWEGADLRQIPDAAKKDRGADFADYQIPGGETFRQFSRRVNEAFAAIRQENGGDLLLVSHAGVNRMILCELLGIPIQNQFLLVQDYCHYHLLWEKRGTVKLYRLNQGR